MEVPEVASRRERTPQKEHPDDQRNWGGDAKAPLCGENLEQTKTKLIR